MNKPVPTTFHAPSGKVLVATELALLSDLEKNGTIAWSDQDVTFNSGFKSRVYVRMRNDLSLSPLLLLRVCAVIMDKTDVLPLTHGKQRCLIGIPTAGYQLAQGVAGLSATSCFARGREPSTCFSFMRTDAKDHGKDQTLIDAPDFMRHTYITVENVISTSKGMMRAFRGLEQAGYPTREMHHVVFADWELGGIESLKAEGYDNVHTLFKMRDVMAWYVESGSWPKERSLEMGVRIGAWRHELPY